MNVRKYGWWKYMDIRHCLLMDNSYFTDYFSNSNTLRIEKRQLQGSVGYQLVYNARKATGRGMIGKKCLG